MPGLSAELKKRYDHPHTQRDGYKRKKHHVQCFAITAGNEIHEQQHSRDTQHNQQYTDPVEEVKSRHAAHAKQSRENEDDQYLDHQCCEHKSAKLQPLQPHHPKIRCLKPAWQSILRRKIIQYNHEIERDHHTAENVKLNVGTAG